MSFFQRLFYTFAIANLILNLIILLLILLPRDYTRQIRYRLAQVVLKQWMWGNKASIWLHHWLWRKGENGDWAIDPKDWD